MPFHLWSGLSKAPNFELFGIGFIKTKSKRICHSLLLMFFFLNFICIFLGIRYYWSLTPMKIFFIVCEIRYTLRYKVKDERQNNNRLDII